MLYQGEYAQFLKKLNAILKKAAAPSLGYLGHGNSKPSYLGRVCHARIFLANNLPFEIYCLNGQLIAQMHVFGNYLLMDGEITQSCPCFAVSKIMLQGFNDILERQVFPRDVFFGKQRTF